MRTPFKYGLLICILLIYNGCNQPSQYHRIDSNPAWLSKKIEIPYYEKDTDYYFKNCRQIVKKTGLKDLLNSKDSLHFRIWFENQIVDICTNNKQVFQGVLSNFTTKVSDSNYYPYVLPLKNIFCDTSKLGAITAKFVYDNCNNLSIFSIPMQDNIKGWVNGTDGYYIAIEYSTPSLYYYRSYFAPSAFKKRIKYAAEIDSLDVILKEKLNLSQRLDTFLFHLPTATYHVGEMAIFDKRYTITQKPPKLKPGEVLPAE